MLVLPTAALFSRLWHSCYGHTTYVQMTKKLVFTLGMAFLQALRHFSSCHYIHNAAGSSLKKVCSSHVFSIWCCRLPSSWRRLEEPSCDQLWSGLPEVRAERRCRRSFAHAALQRLCFCAQLWLLPVLKIFSLFQCYSVFALIVFHQVLTPIRCSFCEACDLAQEVNLILLPTASLTGTTGQGWVWVQTKPCWVLETCWNPQE